MDALAAENLLALLIAAVLGAVDCLLGGVVRVPPCCFVSCFGDPEDSGGERLDGLLPRGAAGAFLGGGGGDRFADGSGLTLSASGAATVVELDWFGRVRCRDISAPICLHRE